MTEDIEIEAMMSISPLLAKLDDGDARRVVRWESDRFGVLPAGRGGQNRESSLSDPIGVGEQTVPESLPELFAAANEWSQAQKALVAGYWFQQILGHEDFDAQQVNDELKHLGHGITNITRALGELMNQRPQLTIQTRKSGKSKQARKRYKITAEGIRAANRMLVRIPEATGSVERG